MAAPKAPRHKVAAALADVAAGASQPEAASRHGIGLRTLERALAEVRGKGQPKTRPRGSKKPPADEAVKDEPLLETLAAELRYARAARKKADTDAGKRQWSKRIEDLVRALERLSPPPAPPPDAVQDELRRLDGVVLGIIEQFFEDADAVKLEEVATE